MSKVPNAKGILESNLKPPPIAAIGTSAGSLEATFYYALNPKGFLLLGNSEAVGNSGSLFYKLIKNREYSCDEAGPERLASVRNLAQRLKKLAEHREFVYLRSNLFACVSQEPG